MTDSITSGPASEPHGPVTIPFKRHGVEAGNLTTELARQGASGMWRLRLIDRYQAGDRIVGIDNQPRIRRAL